MVLEEAEGISRSRILIAFNLIAVVIAASFLPGDAAPGGSSPPVILKGSQDADLIVQVGDIDNLGFGWPDGFDVFSGMAAEKHAYPFQPEFDDPGGTDRIMVGSGYDGHPPRGLDGYTRKTDQPDNLPQTIEIRYNLSGVTVSSALLQIFIDDLQPSAYNGYIQVEINGQRAPFLERELNTLDLSGPVGRLVAIEVPQEFQNDVSSGRFDLLIDDPATGSGDGYAIDFVRLLINPRANYSASASDKAGPGSAVPRESRIDGQIAETAFFGLVEKMENVFGEIGGIIGLIRPSSEQAHVTAQTPAAVPPAQNDARETTSGPAGAYEPAELDQETVAVAQSTAIPVQHAIADGNMTASSNETQTASAKVLAIASDGGCNLYKAVYDPVYDRSEIKLQSSGLETTLAAVSGRAGGLSSDGSGNILVSHAGQISMISPDGSAVTIASGLDSPGQIAPCEEGIYVIVKGGVQRVSFPSVAAEHQESGAAGYYNLTDQQVQGLEGGPAAQATETDLALSEAYQETQVSEIVEESEETELPQASGNLLFMEVWTDRHGQAVSGMPPKMMIDFPGYELDRQTIRSFVPVDIPVQVLAVGGSGFSLSGDLGGGANSGLEPILVLPYELGGVNITAIEGELVTVDHAGESRALLPGEVWEIRRSEIQSNKDVTLNITTTTTVKNHGRMELNVEAQA